MPTYFVKRCLYPWVEVLPAVHLFFFSSLFRSFLAILKTKKKKKKKPFLLIFAGVRGDVSHRFQLQHFLFFFLDYFRSSTHTPLPQWPQKKYITHSPKLRIIFQIFHSLGPDAYFLSSDPGIERFETALSKEIKISKK